MNLRLGPYTVEVRRKPRWKEYPSYAEALKHCEGYEDSRILDVVEAKTRALDSPALTDSEVALLLGVRLIDRDIPRILDFGGGCGAHLLALRFQKSMIAPIIVESPGMAERARRTGFMAVSAIPGVATLLGGAVDVIHASRALQCCPDPIGTLDELLNLKAPVCVITLLPVGRPAVYVSPSMLSDHGPGPMPPGFVDRPVSCVWTVLDRQAVMDRLQAAYKTVLTLPAEGGWPIDAEALSVICTEPK